ncbi:acyl-CoA mutase large subunit family protein [Sediminibacillus halophilus]|uniref:Methylmalonyl-CoA mutase, N-terminal domain n=1 Tax=Sediminibacillus halophilus TaxID=482461 RepID=A0A1G9LNJ2_9BACI|nr:methylmalonyl-CoA mutase family protein [Sediminibacillus halophilus]SDL63443.1 methylmalonyl-CoA mutase, N-terminal domain [Sediminibacillus halophilus]
MGKEQEFSANKQEWENAVKKTVQRYPERQKVFETSSGIPIDLLYAPKHPQEEYQETQGFPGQYPYTRGIQPTMYRSKYWTMRQYAGFGSARETNQRFRYLLEQGQTGLSVAFDLPTQIGYDSDDSMADGEVGKVGVAIDSLHDMETLFDSIPLEKVSTSMTINAPASILLCMYIAVGEKQGVEPARLTGTIQNDILKEYIARGTYIFPPKPSMRLITDIFAYCQEELPRFNTISISGYHIREAGSTAVQEIAFTLANGIAYVDAALASGLDIDQFAPRLAFFFNAHNQFFEEVAKFRAARRIWSKIMKDRFHAKEPKSWKLRFHTQTGGSTLTAQQANNNIVRVALQALSAVLGGTQSLHTNSRDEALSLPTEESARIALRTQQIIANESGAADTIDPLGGSYYVESLTDEIASRAWKYIEKIDGLGGAVQAVEAGYMQREIRQAAYETQMKIESGEEIVIGLNKFVEEEQQLPDLLKVDEELEANQRKAVQQVRIERDATEADRCLNKLEAAAADPGINLMPYILQAVKAYCTIGEICNTLRKEFGEYNGI